LTSQSCESLKMQHDHSLSFATTASGMLGGLSRALSEQFSNTTITFPGVIDVAAYAVVSASVGYCVKVAMDLIYQRFRKGKDTK